MIYIEGQNDGHMYAHTVGIKDKMFGTVRIKPDGPVAMSGQHYPLTELGILNLTKRLVEVAQQDVKYGECEVKFFKDAKIKNGTGQPAFARASKSCIRCRGGTSAFTWPAFLSTTS